MSGRKVALVAIPIAVAGIALAAVFALPLQQTPDQDPAGNEDTESDNGQIIPASATQDCNTVTNRVRNYVVFIDGIDITVGIVIFGNDFPAWIE